VLQLDCPDLAAGRHDLGERLQEFRRRAKLHIEALNHATRDIPAEAMRLHLCWGSRGAARIRAALARARHAGLILSMRCG
jgi:hypothetical protein